MHGKRGLYLDFYPPIIHPETQKQTRREHLRLYVFEKPKAETEKEHNKETRILAENIRAQRQLEFQAGVYGFISAQNKKKDFLAFFKKLAESKLQGSKGNYANWLSVLKYLKEFTHEICRFSDVSERFCLDFKDFLLSRKTISKNTAASYFDKFKAAVRSAFDDKLLSENPAKRIKSIKPTETQREFLTLDELQKLAVTPFQYEDLRRASLFSALTGLRYSDIEKLIWSEVYYDAGQGFYIRFTQMKTKAVETLPINKEAFNLLGKRGQPGDRVFARLQYSHCIHLPIWIAQSGINKKITFHNFRHTYATLQLTLGSDLYTVSKMLGHRDVKTTQIYAKIIDAKKREAADRITLK